MGGHVNLVSADEVRNRIARAILAPEETATSIGTVVLRPHQVDGARRILGALNTHGGALVCDEVGVGKTFTAAAVIRQFQATEVVAPAALLPMWTAALAATGLRVNLLSMEQFSRKRRDPTNADLVVIDEAHHFRNRNTARFNNVAMFVQGARVLLLSATPVHNRARDLSSLLSLFLGSRADSLSADDLSCCVIRRRIRAVLSGEVPQRIHRPPIHAEVSTSMRDLLMSLPPPVPPCDGDECAALVQFTLLRQWASSNAALRAGLRSRIARARALESALEAGSFPTGNELKSWVTGDSDIQLGFPGLLASPGGDTQLLDAVRHHAQACTGALRAVEASECTDKWRADRLREICRQFPDRKVIAFTQFASTAVCLFQEMKHYPKVALITSGRCQIASGRMSRDDVITRFAPAGSGVSPPPDREDISLLIATDICSEGLNLQDAGVVVHLDIPWTPARLEQRVGRIARMGSAYSQVFVYSFSVPAIAEELLRIEERLRIKERISIGLVGMRDDKPSALTISVADAHEMVLEHLSKWITQTDTSDTAVLGAAARSTSHCFAALVENNLSYELICGDDRSMSGDPRTALHIIPTLSETTVSRPKVVYDTVVRIENWLSQRNLESKLGVRSKPRALHQTLARKIETFVRRTPLHRRADIAILTDSARISIVQPYGAGREGKLTELASNDTPGEEWMMQVANGQPLKTKAEPMGSGFRLIALLVGVPEEACP